MRLTHTQETKSDSGEEGVAKKRLLRGLDKEGARALSNREPGTRLFIQPILQFLAQLGRQLKMSVSNVWHRKGLKRIGRLLVAAKGLGLKHHSLVPRLAR